MIVLDIQMAAELGELFAEVVAEVLRRLAGDLPRPVFLPDDPELAAIWTHDLREQLQDDLQRLSGLFLNPQFGTGEMPLPIAQAEAVCRAASAVRLALRASELRAIPDSALEEGLVRSPDLDEPVRRAYYCYWFLGGLQEMLVRALDPSLDEPSGEQGDSGFGGTFP